PYGTQQHEIRRRMLNCEATLGLGANQLFVKSYESSGRYLAHKTVGNQEVAQLSPAATAEDVPPARLKISRGIAEQAFLSFEAGVKPNPYMRPVAAGKEELTFGPATDDTSKKESVFKIVPGLVSSEHGWISFESRSRPNWFIVTSPDGK